MEKYTFDLQKIQELTSSGNVLQGKLESLVEHTKKYEEQMEKSKILKYAEEDVSQINQISKTVFELQNKLIEITQSNVKNFIFFQDKLLEERKENYTRKLKQLNLDSEQTKEIGIYLIENKNISRVIQGANYVSAISIETWLDILASLEGNSLFLFSIKKARKLYRTILDSRYLEEISKIPEGVSDDIKDEYKKTFYEDPQPFNEFLEHLEEKYSQEELDKKRDLAQKTKEIEKIKELKRKQKEQEETFQDFIRLPKEEFERLRRKKKRKKLPDLILKSPKNQKPESVEISDEVSEKIKKFKSRFENKFEKKYLIQKDEDQDPLEIVRERKKKKEREYKEHLEKFEKDDT